MSDQQDIEAAAKALYEEAKPSILEQNGIVLPWESFCEKRPFDAFMFRTWAKLKGWEPAITEDDLQPGYGARQSAPVCEACSAPLDVTVLCEHCHAPVCPACGCCPHTCFEVPS